MVGIVGVMRRPNVEKSMRKAVNVVEYISRENAIEIVKSGGYWEREDMEVAVTCIEQTPTADVKEVKHGEWIIENSERDWKDKDTYILSIKCSECGKVHFLGTTKYQNEYDKEKLKKLGNYGDYSFCGKCGSKMDKK